MTGLTGPAPHGWNWAGDRDVRLDLVMWVALALLVTGLTVWMIWPLLSTDDGASPVDHGVSIRECVQTGGMPVDDPRAGSRTCVWPPTDY